MNSLSYCLQAFNQTYTSCMENILKQQKWKPQKETQNSSCYVINIRPIPNGYGDKHQCYLTTWNEREKCHKKIITSMYPHLNNSQKAKAWNNFVFISAVGILKCFRFFLFLNFQIKLKRMESCFEATSRTLRKSHWKGEFRPIHECQMPDADLFGNFYTC